MVLVWCVGCHLPRGLGGFCDIAVFEKLKPESARGPHARATSGACTALVKRFLGRLFRSKRR